MSKETALEHLDINEMLTTPDRKYRVFDTSVDMHETPLNIKSTAPRTCNKINGFNDDAGIDDENFNPDTFIFDNYQTDDNAHLTIDNNP